MEGNVGFIGLGAMGWGMAANIRRKLSPSANLCIFDIDRDTCDRFKREFEQCGRVQIMSNARELAEGADAVVSILPSAAVVERTYLDLKDGIAGARKNDQRILLECSTIDSPSVSRIGSKVREIGAGVYIDSPVSGGAPGATAGTLSFMLGHMQPQDSSVFDRRLVDLVKMMAHPDRLFWCGSLGAGALTKIVNNYLSGTILLANCEAMAMGVKSGLDPQLLFRVVSASTGQSFMFSNVNPVPGLSENAPSNRGYEGGFQEVMMIKDMTLAVDAAEAVGVKPSLAKAAREVYREVAEDPDSRRKDATVVYRWLSQKSSG